MGLRRAHRPGHGVGDARLVDQLRQVYGAQGLVDGQGGVHPAHVDAAVTLALLRGAARFGLAGVEYDAARQIARSVRESGGGFLGVRALALRLPSRNRLQISMNIENLDVTQPMDVFRRIEELVHARGGAIEQTEIVGMLPDALLWGAAADRLRLSPDTAQRLLSQRLVEVLSEGERTPQDA